MNKKDLELIERIVYRASDDLAVSIARSFERLEERIDALEDRLRHCMADYNDDAQKRYENIIEVLTLINDTN